MTENLLSAGDRSRLLSFRLWLVATVLLALAGGVAVNWWF
jgi:hypothetical protein